MGKIVLWLSGTEKDPELSRILIELPELSHRTHGVRGLENGAYPQSVTFTWTAGVQAITVLFLRVYASMFDGDKFSILLSGEAGTLASSLDSIFYKDTYWLVDLFGADKTGISNARRIFPRTNPGRRKPGPVEFGLNEKLISHDSVSIYLNEKPLKAQEARILAERLELNYCSRPGRSQEARVGLVKNKFQAVFHEEPSKQSLFKKAMKKEAFRMVSGTYSFTQKALQNNLRTAMSDRSFSKIAGRTRSLVGVLETPTSRVDFSSLSFSEYGLALRSLRDRIFTVSASPMLAGSIPIFQYLRCINGIHVALDYRNSHTIVLANRILSGDDVGDMCVLSIAAAAKVLGRVRRKEVYKPFMFMPKVSHRLVGSPGNYEKVSKNTEFLVYQDETSSVAFYFDSLRDRSLIDKRSTFRSLEPHDITKVLTHSEVDVRSVRAFPFYLVNEIFNDCRILSSVDDPEANKLTVLFVHERILSSPALSQALDICLRKAWLTLCERPDVLNTLYDILYEDKEYEQCILRFTGSALAGASTQKVSFMS